MAVRILQGGGWSDVGGSTHNQLTDNDVLDYLYRMFTSDKGVQVEKKDKRDNSAVWMGDGAQFRKSESRSKQNINSNNTNTNVLVNAFMTVLPNRAATRGGDNDASIHDGRPTHRPIPTSNDTGMEMSRSMFEALLRVVKQVEDAANECIGWSRARIA
jgi:hypothetical protein